MRDLSQAIVIPLESKVEVSEDAKKHALTTRKEGDSLFLLSLDDVKVSDSMNPVLGLYCMPTPAYYLRGSFPTGDLKCVVRGESRRTQVNIPAHMRTTIAQFIAQGLRQGKRERTTARLKAAGKKDEEINAEVANLDQEPMIVDENFDFQFFFEVWDMSDVFSKQFGRNFNMVHHAWAHPEATLGSSMVATLPMGIFTTMEPSHHKVDTGVINNLHMNDLTFMKAFVHRHETDEWSMCCSPDNATFRIQSEPKPYWASMTKPKEEEKDVPKYSHFWTAAIAGLPDPPADSILERSRNRDTADKPNLLTEGFELYTKWEKGTQITAYHSKVFRTDTILQFVQGSIDYSGIYFDGMPDDCSFTFQPTEPVAFTATMLKGGSGTVWCVQYSDDGRKFTTVGTFEKPLTKTWSMLRWKDVGAHKYWRYQCLKNGGTDYYRGVEWYIDKPADSVSAESESKLEAEAQANKDADAKKSLSTSSDPRSIEAEDAAARKKVRVCVSLQWLLHNPHKGMMAAFDKATNLGELVTQMKAVVGEEDEKIIDFLTMFSPVTSWAPSPAATAAREKQAVKLTPSRGWHGTQTKSYTSIIGGSIGSSAGSGAGGGSHGYSGSSFNNRHYPYSFPQSRF